MAQVNETVLRQCRFLSEDDFDRLYQTFIHAFSDYVFQFALTEEQFRNHIILNAVDLDRSIGCFEAGRLVGVSLNGFGQWKGKPTVYDAGTGVIPGRRRRGISNEMFEMMVPVFKREGIEQFLLEVVTSNHAAVRLYEKFHFRPVRELALLQCDRPLRPRAAPADIVIDEISNPDWGLLTSFWDGEPSWQNTVEAVMRSRRMKQIRGAFLDGECVGYIAYSSKFGRVAQCAVAHAHRRRGIGTALVTRMERAMAAGYSMQIINIDKSITGAIEFFNRLGFYERLSQYEMLRTL